MPTQTARVSFMMSGPAFDVSIPPGLDPSPQAESPLRLPAGGRACWFEPLGQGRPTYATSDFDPGYETQGKPELTVWVHHRHAEPEHWFLDWHLPGGTMRTHVRDEDGEGMVAVVASNLEIAAVDDLLPTLVPHSPLGRAVSRAPGYQETIMFVDSHSSPKRMLEIARPGGARTSMRTVGNVSTLGTRIGIDLRGVDIEPADLLHIREELEGQLLPAGA